MLVKIDEFNESVGHNMGASPGRSAYLGFSIPNLVIFTMFKYSDRPGTHFPERQIL